MPDPDLEAQLGEDETASFTSTSQSAPDLGQLMDPKTQEMLQKGLATAKVLNQQYGADKMIIGGGAAMLLTGALLYATKE